VELYGFSVDRLDLGLSTATLGVSIAEGRELGRREIVLKGYQFAE
jgi:hypothetical protein